MLGLDPLATEKSAYDDVLEGIRNLSKAMIDPTRKTPIIVCPNGFISDGGLAFLMGQYVLATPHSSLRFDQPTRGLSFDPTGASYVLNRVGYDFEQIPAKKYASTIAKILALTGFEADAYDMVSTGLATHFVENLHNIYVLETALAVRYCPIKIKDYCPNPHDLKANGSKKNMPISNQVESFQKIYPINAFEIWPFII